MSGVVFDRWQEDHVRSLEEALETARLQLAACGVAALGNTEKSVAERITKDSPYWSASYGDVCGAVGREMQYETELKAARAVVEASRVGSFHHPVCPYFDGAERCGCSNQLVKDALKAYDEGKDD